MSKKEQHKHRWKFLQILPGNFWDSYPTAVYKCVDCEAVKSVYLNNPERESFN